MENELDLVVFEDDKGNEITMEVLDYFFYEGEEYALLTDYDENSECEACEKESCDECPAQEVVIMKVVAVGEDEEEFLPVDDELADKLIALVQEGAFDDEDDEDEEDDDNDEI